MITLILFLVHGIDLIINKHLNNNDVTLSIIAIIALYLEKLIDSAEEITISNILTWKSKKKENSPDTLSS